MCMGPPLGRRLFLTRLGWFGLQWSQKGVQRTTIGHCSALAAERAIGKALASVGLPPWGDLEERMQAFAEGVRQDFHEVPLDLPSMTHFRSRVLLACQGIHYGETLSYGQLARLAGSPRAARAVGGVMADNPLPLIIPCHRVVGANRKLGGFSAPNGLSLKQRLLRLEGVTPLPS
ncbi:MAG: MGMT family protein [Planctomycetaceae bacterium]|nr:MGMT family protein [Planctomycetaceae bacterium]